LLRRIYEDGDNGGSDGAYVDGGGNGGGDGRYVDGGGW
jgi:hypothetical protein